MGSAPSAAPPITQPNGHSSANDTLSPTENKENQPESAPQENGVSPNATSQAPKIDALVRTASAEESTGENGAAVETNSERPASMSPGGTTKKVEGPADIPSQKLAFGEDKRALKALDKVFI
jgi:hypothetical protein